MNYDQCEPGLKVQTGRDSTTRRDFLIFES
jgi:hypothetical protein